MNWSVVSAKRFLKAQLLWGVLLSKLFDLKVHILIYWTLQTVKSQYSLFYIPGIFTSNTTKFQNLLTVGQWNHWPTKRDFGWVNDFIDPRKVDFRLVISAKKLAKWQCVKWKIKTKPKNSGNSNGVYIYPQ